MQLRRKARTPRCPTRPSAVLDILPDMIRGDLSFAATGITDGSLLKGVHFTKEAISTHSVVMRASTHTVRWMNTDHPATGKFD